MTPIKTHGTRLPDNTPIDTILSIQGAYCFYKGAWWVCTPNGLGGRLSPAHHVEQHEDNTVSVMPQPNNSNSILVHGWTEAEGATEWHGYINRGQWEQI